MAYLKYLLKMNTILLLVCFLPLTSYTANAQVPSNQDLRPLIDHLNSQSMDIESVVFLLKKVDPNKASELKKWAAKNRPSAFPKTEFYAEDGLIKAVVNGKPATFKILKEGTVEIGFNGKKSVVDFSMSIDEMVNKIGKDLGTSTAEKVSFLNFFIDDVQALVVELWIAWSLLTALAVGYFSYINYEASAFIKNPKKLCNELDKRPIENIDITEAVEKFNDLSSSIMTVCAINSDGTLKNIKNLDQVPKREAYCGAVRIAKECLKSKINEIQRKSVNTATKTFNKYMIYDSEKEQFVRANSSK